MENDFKPSLPKTDPADLQAQYDSLHSLLVSLMLLVIVISGTFFIFLWRQSRTASADLEMVKMNYAGARAQFDKTQPVIDELVKKVQEFGRTNAEFAPILAKYRLNTTASAPSTAPASKLPSPGKK